MIPADTEERIGKLRKAESDINDTADTIEECLCMSGLETRFGDIPDRLRSIASSNREDSVANLIRELEYADEDHPVWTRPLASVKNVDRKDV